MAQSPSLVVYMDPHLSRTSSLSTDAAQAGCPAPADVGAGGAGGGWESIYENDQSDKVLNKEPPQNFPRSRWTVEPLLYIPFFVWLLGRFLVWFMENDGAMRVHPKVGFGCG